MRRRLPADAVAQFMADHDEDVEKVFAHLGNSPRMSFTNDPVGFECHVNEGQALKWIAQNRPHFIEKISQSQAT